MGVVTVGGPVDRVKISLCLYAEDLDPGELTALLNCAPTSSHVKGARSGPRSPPAKRGGWFLSVQDTAPTDFDAMVLSVLDQVPDDEALWQDLRERFEVQLRVGLFQSAWNRDFWLDAATVARVSRLRAALVFDIYCECDDDDTGSD